MTPSHDICPHPDLTAAAAAAADVHDGKTLDFMKEREREFPGKADEAEEDEVEAAAMAFGHGTEPAYVEDKMSSSSSEVAQFDDFDDQGR